MRSKLTVSTMRAHDPDGRFPAVLVSEIQIVPPGSENPWTPAKSMRG